MAEEVVAFVAVGSNIDPAKNIPLALDLLLQSVRVDGASTFYCTAPIGRPNQDDYRNGIFRLRTRMLPRVLKFDTLRVVERQLGRVRSDDSYAPRTIDLDLVLYGDHVDQSDDLELPDPDIRIRPFVAVPLLELAPDLRLPDSGEMLAEIVTAAMDAALTPDIALTETLRVRLRNE